MDAIALGAEVKTVAAEFIVLAPAGVGLMYLKAIQQVLVAGGGVVIGGITDDRISVILNKAVPCWASLLLMITAC